MEMVRDGTRHLRGPHTDPANESPSVAAATPVRCASGSSGDPCQPRWSRFTLNLHIDFVVVNHAEPGCMESQLVSFAFTTSSLSRRQEAYRITYKTAKYAAFLPPDTKVDSVSED